MSGSLIPALGVGIAETAIAVVGGANAARSAWDALYQVNPIFLQGGSFANFPLGVYPLSGLAGQLLALGTGLATGASDPVFGRFKTIPGGTLVKQTVATYPFASQQIAANATIQEPLNVSLLLTAPVKSGFGYALKAAILTSLKIALTAHNNAGGTYIVFTPAYMYQDGLLLDVTDVTDGESEQTQIQWQFDFFFPLITQAGAQAAYNTAMSKFAGGQQVNGQPTWFGL